MMKDYEKLYKAIQKKLSVEEMAESYMIPDKISEEEQKSANDQLEKYRFQRLKEMSEEQRLYADIIRLKFLMEKFIENEDYDLKNNFGTFLKEYVRLLNKTKKQVASDLNLHYTKFSRLLNDRDNPNIELTYRLEQHSGGQIPALIWWKLSIKKQEYLILKDKKKRKKEAAKVKNALKFRA